MKLFTYEGSFVLLWHMIPMKKILIQERNKDVREVLQIALESVNYMIFTLNDATNLLSAIKQFQPHLLIMEFHRKTEACMDIFNKVFSNHPRLPVIAFSSNPQCEKLYHGLGFCGFIPKPFDLKQLYKTISDILTDSTPTD